MKAAISNIALPSGDHTECFHELAEIGFQGVEVAPSRRWKETWQGLDAASVDQYRRDMERAGLQCVGLHSLFFDHPDLGLFKPDRRSETLSFLVHLSHVCRDLGGRTLIYGGGRRRGETGQEAAYVQAVSFLTDLLPRVEDHGTVFCFEPLGPRDTDFLNTVGECLDLVRRIDHPSFRIQLDAKALVENGELSQETVRSARAHLVHVHANEPGLGVLGSSGKIDHQMFGRLLTDAAYAGWVTAEQRMVGVAAPLADAERSYGVLAHAYV